MFGRCTRIDPLLNLDARRRMLEQPETPDEEVIDGDFQLLLKRPRVKECCHQIPQGELVDWWIE